MAERDDSNFKRGYLTAGQAAFANGLRLPGEPAAEPVRTPVVPSGPVTGESIARMVEEGLDAALAQRERDKAERDRQAVAKSLFSSGRLSKGQADFAAALVLPE